MAAMSVTTHSRPRIVVLDGFTLNPGDLSWDELQQLGHCEIFERTHPAEMIARAANAEIVLTNKAQLNRAIIEALPRLKYIGILATGTNAVDLAAAREKNIPVTNVPAYSTRSVAQATIALLLELTNRVGHHAERVRNGDWCRAADWCFWDGPILELQGLTFGIVGYGQIGAEVAKIAAAFGMRVLAHNSSPKSAPAFVNWTDLETLLSQSDVVSLHCPLTPQTQGLINSRRLSLLKSSALLINTSRGGLIDEPALAEALNKAQIAGAALDVLSTEPPPPTNPLLQARNCLITPHNAWGSHAARQRLLDVAIENIRAFLNNVPKNVVN